MLEQIRLHVHKHGPVQPAHTSVMGTMWQPVNIFSNAIVMHNPQYQCRVTTFHAAPTDKTHILNVCMCLHAHLKSNLKGKASSWAACRNSTSATNLLKAPQRRLEHVSACMFRTTTKGEHAVELQAATAKRHLLQSPQNRRVHVPACKLSLKPISIQLGCIP